MACCFERHVQHLFRMLCSDCVRSRVSWKPGCLHKLLMHDCCIKCLNFDTQCAPVVWNWTWQTRPHIANAHAPMELKHMEMCSTIQHCSLDVRRDMAQHLFRMLCSDSVRSRASSNSVCLHEFLDHDCCMKRIRLELPEQHLLEVETHSAQFGWNMKVQETTYESRFRAG